MTKVLVTGCAGFIGSNLTDELVKKGYEVIGIDNLSRGSKKNLNPNIKFHKVDIRDKNLGRYLVGVDTIFHLAALARIQPSITEPELYHDNNVNGTFNLLIQAVKAGVRRIVFSSSSSVYGVQTEFPETEESKLNPLNPYAAGKQVNEIYMRMFSSCYGIETVSLRYFNVYGPRQVLEGSYATVIGIFLSQVKNGEPMTIIGDGTKRRDFTWVGDVVQANIKAMKSKKVGSGEVINIGRGQDYSINQVAGLVKGMAKFVEDRPFEALKTLAGIKKAKELLNWEPKVSLEKGIERLKSGQ